MTKQYCECGREVPGGELFQNMKRKNAALRAGLVRLERENKGLAELCFKEFYRQFGSKEQKEENEE